MFGFLCICYCMDDNVGKGVGGVLMALRAESEGLCVKRVGC